MRSHKSETQKAATQIFNGLLFLTNGGDSYKAEVLELVKQKMEQNGYDTIMRMVEAAQKVVL